MSRKIFISAVNKELRSYRKLVSESLRKRGYTPVDEEIFGLTDQEIVQLLKDRLQPCDAVICLIGERYGAEPSRPLDGFGRRSFTQLEYLFARAMTEPRPKHVSLFLTTGATPVDRASDESGELQRPYRDEVTRDRNWRAFNDANELRAEIAELRFPWEELAEHRPCNLPPSIGTYARPGRLQETLAVVNAYPLQNATDVHNWPRCGRSRSSRRVSAWRIPGRRAFKQTTASSLVPWVATKQRSTPRCSRLVVLARMPAAAAG